MFRLFFFKAILTMLYRVIAKLFAFPTGPSPDELVNQVEWCLRTDDPHAVDEVVSLHYDALEYSSATHDQRRLLRQGNSQDLEKAIAFYREALALQLVGHPDRPVSLNNLGSGLSTRFKHQGNDKDLDEAIMLHMEVLSLHSVGHPDRSSSLNILGKNLFTHFEHRGNDQDLNEAIALFREVLSFCPVGDPERFESLCNLGIPLYSRFKHQSKDQDLDEVITLYREALILCLVGHQAQYPSLNTLAVQLSTRFKRRGNDQDLDEAIMLHREALSLRSLGLPYRFISLHNLGNDLSTRFMCRGNDQDLDEAIRLQREALSLRSVGHPDRSMLLSNLGDHLSICFKLRGNDEDLDEAITLCREALASHPVGHPLRFMSLNHLGSGLSTRFDHRGSDQDLDEAFTIHTEALALQPSCNGGNGQDLDKAIAFFRETLAAMAVGCPERSLSLFNLGGGVATRFNHQGNDQDLDEAITLCREPLSLHQAGNPHMSMSLNNLAAILSSRFQYRGNVQDLDEAIALHREALSFHLVGHPDRFMSLDHLGGQLSTRFDHRGNDQDLDKAIALSREALALCPVNHPHRFSSLNNLGNELFTRFKHRDNGQDLEEAIALHREALSLCSVSHPNRYPSLNNLANTLSVRSEHQGDEQDLDEAIALHREALSLRSVGHPDQFTSSNNLGNVLLWLISRLLSPICCPINQDYGPIIVLVASKSYCHAIIVPHKEPPVNVGLAINVEKLERLVFAFQRTVNNPLSREKQGKLIEALRELWVEIVHPVVENLANLQNQGREYGGAQPLSSTSCLCTLLASIGGARRRRDQSLPVSFAAIGQNHPKGASSILDCVEPELTLVQSLLPRPPMVSFTKITSIDATKSRALSALQDNPWLHFACHRTQNHTEPFKSAFLMCDEPLSLLDITQMDLSSHAFAFLSACETAVGDFHTPDEVIHLVAALQFAGVNSVVGTLWEVNDSAVQRLVEAFYKNFCGDGTMNSKRAARALHRAVQLLADDKDMPLDQRIVFAVASEEHKATNQKDSTKFKFVRLRSRRSSVSHIVLVQVGDFERFYKDGLTGLELGKFLENEVNIATENPLANDEGYTNLNKILSEYGERSWNTVPWV
ncbi:CHAT domain-containing protein [Suillus subalutaceus]|uniref:CHAT domain-containing protein n=1 Tax=Suillus subalutaceus TaxID=48586 RepID=UPI001B867C77|nr:CHAT domain-containing protein [Suillus subalutaceus]KAG1844498.1 CHAT domain-containing protein [Suillus subalutaceus]